MKIKEEQLKGCEFMGKVIEGALLMDHYSGYKLIFKDDNGKILPNEYISFAVCEQILENDFKRGNVAIIKNWSSVKDCITVKSPVTQERLYLDLDRNRAILEPKNPDDLAFNIYPMKLVEFYKRLDEKIDLIAIYKEWYKETYNKEFS